MQALFKIEWIDITKEVACCDGKEYYSVFISLRGGFNI